MLFLLLSKMFGEVDGDKGTFNGMWVIMSFLETVFTGMLLIYLFPTQAYQLGDWIYSAYTMVVGAFK